MGNNIIVAYTYIGQLSKAVQSLTLPVGNGLVCSRRMAYASMSIFFSGRVGSYIILTISQSSFDMRLVRLPNRLI